MTLRADIDAHTAEGMLPNFMRPEDIVDKSAQTSMPSTPRASSEQSPPPSATSEPIDDKVEAQRLKLQKLTDEKFERLKQKTLAAEATKKKKEQEKEEEKQRKLKEQEDHKGSIKGQCEAFLTGLDRDIDKCKDTMAGTATSGLKAGFAREWRATFAAILKLFQTHKQAIENLKDNDSEDATVLSTAKDAALNFKAELRNYIAAKNAANRSPKPSA